MRSTIQYVLLAFLITGFAVACSSDEQQQPTEEQKQQKEQARQDSIEQAKADSIARAKADSMAQAKQEQKEKEQKEKDQLTLEDIAFNTNGAFSVQVEAWRSKGKAEEQVSKWKKRGFSNAYVIKAGKEESGDIWFRVRLGKVGDKQTAQQLAKLVQKKYNEKTWISESKTGT